MMTNLTRDEVKAAMLEAFEESAWARRVERSEHDISELKQDVAVLKQDVAELKKDVAELKKDVAELKKDVAELKHDVAVLKYDVAVLKSEMAAVKVQMNRMSVLMEEFNDKLTVALELLQHSVSLIPAVRKHDLQISGTKTDVEVTQTILQDHIQNKNIHVAPKRGRKKKSSTATEGEL